MRFGLREIIFVLLVLAVPVGSYYGYFRNANDEMQQARKEIGHKQDKLADLEKATKRMSDLGKEIDSLQQAIEVVETQLPAQREEEVILKEVWQLASKHNLSLKQVRTDSIVPAAQYATLPIRMELVGNFDGFYKFLLAVEKLPRITRMPRMDLKRLKGRGEAGAKAQGKMRAKIVLRIFFEGKHNSGNKQTACAGQLQLNPVL